MSDPTALEERVADASLVLGVNAYRELCALYLGGSAVLASRVILRCATHAALRAKQTVEILKIKLAIDAEEREAKRPVGFASCCATDKITSLSQDRIRIQLSKFRLNLQEEMEIADEKKKEIGENCMIANLGDNTAELVDTSTKEPVLPIASESKYGEGGPSQWIVEIASPPAVDVVDVVQPKKIVETIGKFICY